jgi:hypothetical protein
MWQQRYIYGAAIISGNMCWCESSSSFVELLFIENICLCGSSDTFTELLLYQETYFGVGAVVDLRSCYFLRKYVLAW